MRSGDIALVRTPDLIGWTIRLATRSRYNHVRLVLSAAGDVLEANPSGAEYGTVRTGDLIVSPPLTDTQRADIPLIAGYLAGTPYGFGDVAALGLAQFGITLPSVRRRIEQPDRLFCSQLVDYAWQLAGFHAFTDGRTPQDVTPGDLADLAFRSGWPVTTALVRRT